MAHLNKKKEVCHCFHISLMVRVTNPLGSDWFFSFVGRSQTGNGAGCLCDDCREGGEALPHDDDQESAPD